MGPKPDTVAAPELRADIRRLMEMNGATSLGVQFANILAEVVLDAVKRRNPGISDRAVAIVKDVVSKEVAEEMSGPDNIQEQLVDAYAKHFTHDDITALLAFYSTPVGRKLVAAQPFVMQDAAAIGQKYAQAHAARMASFVQERLRAEGLIK